MAQPVQSYARDRALTSYGLQIGARVDYDSGFLALVRPGRVDLLKRIVTAMHILAFLC